MIDDIPFPDFLGFVDDAKGQRPPDPIEQIAKEELRAYIEENKEQVFFSRQLEVLYEDKYFHWITNRAIRHLEGEGFVNSEVRQMITGGTIKLYWHKNFRYYKRSATKLTSLVEEYSNPNVSLALGLHGEIMVLTLFADAQFVQLGRETRSFRGKIWNVTEHDVDFIFERDEIAYGVEVKNTLGYMDKKEFDVKVKLCLHLGIRPLFAVRMMPKSWMYELSNVGGFGLIFKYQLYHWTHKELAKRVASEIGLPVDAPKRLSSSTMSRFLRWHNQQIDM